ncbi:MAG: hypothetical protein HFJ43_04710 [Clostridia bacterium]|nr:hypothetical protein [Clostridia bacterium]
MDFTKDIYLNTDKIYENSSLIILYNGVLSENTDKKVFLHYGYNNTWDKKDEIKLKRTESGLLGVLRISAGSSFQFVFRDSDNNWDNNNNSNYVLPILEKKEDKVLEFGPSEINKKIEEAKAKTSSNLLEASICSSDDFEFDSTYTIDKSTVPTDTIINKLSFNSESNSFYFAKKVIEDNKVSLDEKYNNFVSNVHSEADNKETTMVAEERPEFKEDLSSSLVPIKEKKLAGRSRLYIIKKRIKVAFLKFAKLVKTSLSYDEDHNF